MTDNGSEKLPAMSFDEALTRFIRVDPKEIKDEKKPDRKDKKSSDKPPNRVRQQ